MALDDLMLYFEAGPIKVSAPEPIEDILVLCLLLAGYSYVRIGAIFGISKQSSYKRVSRAIETAAEAKKQVATLGAKRHNNKKE